MTLIDIVVAVRNEELTIIPFIESIRNINLPDSSVRMIFIEDGSTDNTLNLLNSLKYHSKDIDAISLINPFGQGVALAWGIARSKADAVISIDIDGSHPVEIIKEMIDKYHQGFDVVQGIRIAYRRDSWYRQVGSNIYFFIFSLVTGIDLHKQNVHFRLMNKKACDIFVRNKPWWYSLRTNFRSRDNIKTCYIPFTAPERASGKSKFNFGRLFVFAFRSFLTLTKPSRFIILLVPFIFFVCLIYSINLWISAIFLLLPISLGVNYIRIRFVDYSSLVKEKSIQ
jgi:glycosyltransferase involved in cell wall biosynthesis